MGRPASSLNPLFIAANTLSNYVIIMSVRQMLCLNPLFIAANTLSLKEWKGKVKLEFNLTGQIGTVMIEVTFEIINRDAVRPGATSVGFNALKCVQEIIWVYM